MPRDRETEAGQKGREEEDGSVEDGERKACEVGGGMEARMRGETQRWKMKAVGTGEGSRQGRRRAGTQLFGRTQAPFGEECLWNTLHPPHPPPPRSEDWEMCKPGGSPLLSDWTQRGGQGLPSASPSPAWAPWRSVQDEAIPGSSVAPE